MASLLQRVPVHIVCDSLSYLSVFDLLCNVQLGSKDLRRLVRAVIGMDEVDPTMDMVDDELPLDSIAKFEPLLKRLLELQDLRGQFDQLISKKNNPAMLANSLILIDAVEYLCVDRYESKFEKLVAKDDKDLETWLDIPYFDYKKFYCDFRKFVQLADYVAQVVRHRKEFLFLHFKLETGDRQNPAARERGALTEHGTKSCYRIFDFFDFDKDDRLGWIELSNINHAAGLPLSRSAFAWVQQSYETDESGKLTRNGYREMFLENFVRVPRLMYKDLIRLHAFIDENSERMEPVPLDDDDDIDMDNGPVPMTRFRSVSTSSSSSSNSSVDDDAEMSDVSM